jgi:hypothetical protein
MVEWPRWQSFERFRWRDLSRVKQALFVVLVGVISGAVGETIKLTEFAARQGRDLEEFVHRYIPQIHDLIFVEHPGIAVAVICGVLAFKYVQKKPALWLLDRILPDPASFARSELEKDTLEDPLNWRTPNRPFVGRSTELRALVAFAEMQGHFSVWSMYGPSGIGKSYLAAQWLKSLYRNGWDIGRLDAKLDEAAVRRWKPRAPTAFVFDDAADSPELWTSLGILVEATQDAQHRVCVLLVAQTPINLPTYLERQLAEALAATWPTAEDGSLLPALVVSKFTEGDMSNLVKVIRGHDAPLPEIKELLHRVRGRPLYAVILASDATLDATAEIDRRADAVLNRINARLGVDGLKLLALAALTGPCPLELAQGTAKSIQTHAQLTELFPWAPHGQLDKVVPVYEPEIEGGSLLLSMLASLSAPARDEFIVTAFCFAEEVAARRVSTIFADRPEGHAAWILDKAPQTSGDDLPARPKKMPADLFKRRSQVLLALDRSRSKRVRDNWLAQMEPLRLSAISALKLGGSDVALATLDELMTLSSGFVGDRLMGLQVVGQDMTMIDCAAKIAIADYRKRDECVQRMIVAEQRIAIFRDQYFPTDITIAELAAGGAVVAISSYGYIAADAKRRTECLGRMIAAGEDLLALWENRFPKEIMIARQAAKGMLGMNRTHLQIAVIDEARRLESFTEVMTNDQRLNTLCDDHFPEDVEIALSVADGDFSAIANYGEIGLSDSMLRHGCLARIAAAERRLTSFSNNRFPTESAVALKAANGAINSIKAYGEIAQADSALQQECLERVAEAARRLAALADERFPNNAEMALIAAQGAVNMINVCGTIAIADKGQRVACLTSVGTSAQWAAALSTDRFPANLGIARLAGEAAFDAFIICGRVALIDESSRTTCLDQMFACEERLEELLANDRFSTDNTIADRMAQAARSAIVFYGDLAISDETCRGQFLVRMAAAEQRLVWMSDTQFSESLPLALEAAKGAANAIVGYGDIALIDQNCRADCLDKIATAEQRLATLSDNRFPHEPGIALAAAKGAVAAIRLFGKLPGGDMARLKARGRLASLGQRFPGVPEIQRFVSKSGVWSVPR